MTFYDIISNINLVILAVSLVVFGRMLWAGRLSEKHLRLGPTRDLHQPRGVYAFAIGGVLLYGTLKLTISVEQPLPLLLIVEIIPYALIGLLLGRVRASEAGFRKVGLLPRWPRRDLRWGVLGGWVALGLGTAVSLTIHFISKWRGFELDTIGHSSLTQLGENFSVPLLISLCISAIVMAPLIEEIVFRGLLQTSLVRVMNGHRWPALVIASAVFSVIHWWVVPWHNLIVLFVLGLTFGYLYERTGSLLPPILAHAVFNAANIAMMLSVIEKMP